MSATAEAPARPRSRGDAAKLLRDLLTDEPQSMAALRRRVLGDEAAARKSGSDDVVRSGLAILEAQNEAKRIGRAGWVRYDADIDAEQPSPQEFTFEGDWGMVAVSDMFIDEEYQRPLSTFVDRIVRRFNTTLFQTLTISDRGRRAKPRYAVVDGQTRWAAARRLGIVSVPCVIHHKLTPQQEAELFADLQKERRGLASWFRFRADLYANKPDALAIKELVETTGFEIGIEPNKIRSIAALEACYARDPFQLSRSLAAYREAFGERPPEDVHIRGLHRFFRDYPIPPRGKRRQKDVKDVEVDDDRLVRRLKTTTPEGLVRSASVVKEGDTENRRGGRDLWMALALQKMYQSGGR